MYNALTSANILTIVNEGLEPGRGTVAAKDAFHKLFHLCDYPSGGWQFLENSDFFNAPASTMYHGNWPGGLAEHSLLVLLQTVKLCTSMGVTLPGRRGEVVDGVEQPLDEERLAYLREMVLAALLHDVSKADYYEQSTRNVKDESGQWRQVPFFKRREGVPSLPHGVESLSRIERWRPLGAAWRSAVVHHMGAFCQGNLETFSVSCRAYPEVLLLHTADMWAAQVKGV